jgi:tRNA nucleotidyltransferase (CCA-adding enzyme)
VARRDERGFREDARVRIPDDHELFDRVRALPAAGPLLERLRGVGLEDPAHLVGGAVRDLLLGGKPYDLDLVIEGDAAAFAARLGGALAVHDRFGTSTVTLDGYSYDIARARRETYARPGALPDVEPAPLAEDLLRRDFTVNAVAIALGGAHPGRLSGAPGALEDLDARRLRVLHDRSFIDDPTRLLRLVRYASRLGFAVEPRTRRRAEEAVRSGALATVSRPRVGAELRLLAAERDPLAALRCLRALELDREIHPAFGLRDDELAARALRLLGDDGRRDRLALALAARSVAADDLRSVLDALAFEAQDRDAIVAAATRADEVAAALSQARSPSEIAAAVAGASPELVALAGALGPWLPAREWLHRLRHISLEIDGHDLLASGVPEGPAVGRGLEAALAAKLDGRVEGRGAELAEALRATRATE